MEKLNALESGRVFNIYDGFMDKENFSLEEVQQPLFLQVKSRDTVLVGQDEICKVLSFVGGARDPLAPTIFQVVNLDTGEIKFVHGEEVKEIVCSWEEEKLRSPTELPLSNFLPTVENYKKKIKKNKLNGSYKESTTSTELQL